MTQAWGISLIMGLPFDEKAKAPELYHVDIPVEVYVEPTETEAPTVEETQEELFTPEPETVEVQSKWKAIEKWVLLIAGLVALAIFRIIMPKKPKKRNRREKPKMNWDV